MIKKETLAKNGLSYDETVKYAEDTLFAAKLIYCSESFYYLKNEYLYYYRQVDCSRSKLYEVGLWKQYCHLCDAFFSFFSGKGHGFEDQIHALVIYYAGITLRKVNLYQGSFFDKYRIRKEIINSDLLRNAFQHYKVPKCDNNFIWKQKVLILLIKYRMTLLYGICVSEVT